MKRPSHGADLAAMALNAFSSEGAKCGSDGWQPGQLVRSIAGRDKGRYYLVLAVKDREVLLSDGRNRPRAHPKVKNIRHVQPTHRVAADFDAAGGKIPADEQIRAAIAEMLSNKVKEG